MNRILPLLISIILIVLPYLPVLESIIPKVTPDNFIQYLSLWMLLGVIMVGLFWLRSRQSSVQNKDFKIPTVLLLSLGIIVIAPLHLGPPNTTSSLPQFSAIEQFRFGLLILASMIFGLALIKSTQKFWPKLSTLDRLIAVPIILMIPLMLWDNGDSFMFSSYFKEWVAAGKNPDDFFPNYNFHNNWRAAGRILSYACTTWLCIIFLKEQIIKKWAGFMLIGFCLIGIGLCFAFVFAGPAFYAPFMVPAVVLAPAYWLGLALQTRETFS